MSGATVIEFELACAICPGDGVVRGMRAGVDWPMPCSCEARQSFTQYSLARLIDEDPKTIVRVHQLRARPSVAGRILDKLVQARLV